jgi:hypothetical protein
MGRGLRSSEHLKRRESILLKCNKLLEEFDERYSINENDLSGESYQKYRFNF